MGSDSRPGFAKVAALGWAAFILLLCLTPNPSVGEGRILWCLVCTEQGMADLLLNLALYLPLGFFLRLTTGSWTIPLAAGFLLSLGVETAQLWIPGRFTTLSDLIANTAGSGIGALLPRLLTGAPAWRGGWPLRVAAVACVTGLISAPGVLFYPSVPDGPLYGNWTPRISGQDYYAGAVFSAEIGGIPLPSQRLTQSELVRDLLTAGAPLTFRFEATDPTESSVPVFRLLTEAQVTAVHLAAQGLDLVLHERMRADAARLDRPGIRIRGALAIYSPGDTISLRVQRVEGGGVAVRLGEGAPEGFGWHLGRGWALLWALDRLPPSLQRILDFGWILLLLVPIGAVAPSWTAVWVLSLLPLSTLVALPFLTPALPTPTGHLLAALTGIVLGQLIRAVAATNWWRAATSSRFDSRPRSGIRPAQGPLV